MIDQGLDEIDIHGVYQLLVVENGMSLATKSKHHTYWFDRTTNKLVLAKTNDIIENGQVKLALSSFDRDDVGAIAQDESYVLIDQSNKKLVKAVNGIRNLAKTASGSDELQDAFDKFVDGFDGILLSRLNEFNPNQTLYISDSNMLSTASNTVNKVIFSLGIKSIPRNRTNVVELTQTKIVLPSSVLFVSNGAFSNITTEAVIETLNKNVVFAEGSVSEQIKSVSRIVEKELTDFPTFDINWTYEANGTRMTYPNSDLWYLIPTPSINLNKQAYSAVFYGEQVSNHYLINGILFNQQGQIVAANNTNGYITDVIYNFNNDLPNQTYELSIFNPLVNFKNQNKVNSYDEEKFEIFVKFTISSIDYYLKITGNEVEIYNSNLDLVTNTIITENIEIDYSNEIHKISINTQSLSAPQGLVIVYDGVTILEKKIK